MEKAAGHILKSNNVKLEGRFHLNTGQGSPGLAKGRNETSTPVQVRVVENHPEFAVLELICGCGAKTYIRCEYTDTQSTEQRTDQKK